MYKIKSFIKAIFQPDAFATFLNYIIKIFLNPIIVFFVPYFLTENQQGYWYTFGSIAGLTVFADLGFTSIMTQYAAHEYTYLNFNKKSGEFVGRADSIERMSSLFKFVVRWIWKVLLIAFIIILVLGILMFSNNEDGVKWQIPWILYTLASVFNFASQIMLSFYEGCDQFATTQRIRTVASSVHCITAIALLICGAGLYALSIPLFLKGTIVFKCLDNKFGASIRQMIHCEIKCRIAWTKEFVPLLGKYAVSWVSGYFASQIYSPLTFALFGSVVAGKVGYSLSIVQAIYTVANVWSLISMPKYNMAVEKREWKQMDELLKRNIVYSILVYVIGIGALFASRLIPVISNIIWTRILSIESILILSLAYCLSLVAYAMAVYLRAHKKEPFMVVSILSGIISMALTYILTRSDGVDYIFIGLFLSEIIVLPIGGYILMRFRKIWHK